jgi:hypothetical protein
VGIGVLWPETSTPKATTNPQTMYDTLRHRGTEVKCAGFMCDSLDLQAAIWLN